MRWGLCALFAAMVTLAVLQFSFRHGRLILFPTYDDVSYFADGLQRLQTFYDFGMGGVVHHYFAKPPHSPYASLMAFTGFALFGFNDWAPYVMNSLLAFGYFLVADRMLRGAAGWQKITCFVFVAALPFVGMAVHEFRPDHAVALFTTVGVLTLLCGPFVHGNASRRMTAGMWFGIAMLTKPPVFPQTLALGGAALVLATVSDWLVTRRVPQKGNVARAWLTVLVPFVLIPLPHYLYDHTHIFAYIYEILFGNLKESFQMKGTLGDHLVYYLTGGGGKIMLGRDVWLLLALLVVSGVGVAALGRRGDIVRGGALLLMVVLAWLIATANRTKQEFFGLTFDTLLTSLVLFLLGRVLVAGRLRGGWPRCAAAVLILAAGAGVLLFQWPTRGGNFATGWQAERRAIVEGVFHTIVSRSTFGGADVAPAPDPSIPDQEKITVPTPTVILCGIGDVNDDVLKYMALQKQYSIKIWFNQYATTPQQIVRDFDGADFIFAAESGTGLIADFLPCSAWQDMLLATVRGRGNFREVGKWTFHKTGRSMYLFQRSSANTFVSFIPGEGMGAIEGPFPDQHLPIVRWGYGPASKIKVTAPADGTYDMYWKARTDFQGQIVTVKVDGQEVAQEPVPGSFTVFSDAHIPLKLKAGEHEIEFDYNKWRTDTPRPLAVLFQFLQIQRDELQDSGGKK